MKDGQLLRVKIVKGKSDLPEKTGDYNTNLGLWTYNKASDTDDDEIWLRDIDWYLQPIEGWVCKCGEKSTGSMKLWICNICGMEVPDEDNPDKLKTK